MSEETHIPSDGHVTLNLFSVRDIRLKFEAGKTWRNEPQPDLIIDLETGGEIRITGAILSRIEDRLESYRAKVREE